MALAIVEPARYRLLMSEMTPQRAAAIVALLKMRRAAVWREMNALAGTNYQDSDVYKWCQPGGRGPSVAFTLYLRMKILSAWRDRQRQRKYGPPGSRRAQMIEVVAGILGGERRDVALRLERRIRLTIDNFALKPKRRR